MASEQTKQRLRRELQRGADGGAGLVELLDHLEATNGRLGRWEKLSKEERDDLSLYCWSLKTSKPNTFISNRAETMWGSFKSTATSGRRRFSRRSGLTPR
jgi:hypothetical protein